MKPLASWATIVKVIVPERLAVWRTRDAGRNRYRRDVVKVFEHRIGETYPDLDWETKLAFRALAGAYQSM